jgi:hypothetical protein
VISSAQRPSPNARDSVTAEHSCQFCPPFELPLLDRPKLCELGLVPTHLLNETLGVLAADNTWTPREDRTPCEHREGRVACAPC